MKTILTAASLLLCAATFTAHAASRTFTNALGGNWYVAANWSPNGVPGSLDAAFITNAGTYTVFAETGAVACAVMTIGGGAGTQTLIYGTTSGQLLVTNSTVQANGVLVVTNGGLTGSLGVRPGGRLNLDCATSMFLYNFALTNQGTLSWTNGSLSIGGNNSDTTFITNSGLWQIAGNANMNYGGGSSPVLINSGTVRKLTGTGLTSINMDLINLSSGLVDVQSGTLQFFNLQTNSLGGSLTATAPGTLNFSGRSTDAGGSASGSGTIQMVNSGIFYFRTNIVAGLKLAGGDLYIITTNTFQQAGVITNLTLDGAQLHGTNRLGGTLTVNAGSLTDKLTVQPGGQLLLSAPGGVLLYGFQLINQGTITWSGAGLAVGGNPGTIISNSGTWTITGDAAMNFGGGNLPYFTNCGIVRKISGIGVSSLAGVTFINQTSGIVQVDTGTLTLPTTYDHLAGTLRLNGGTFGGSPISMTGGTLDGTGIITGSPTFSGGTISPGQSPGLIQLQTGLTLGSNAVFVVDGTGTTPGTGYDQLAVTGFITLSNATLQVTSLPSVSPGTTFTLIDNDGADPIQGTFLGLPENALLTVSGQPFRIHYAGGTGNDVTLVRDTGGGPLLSLSGGGYSNGVFRILGNGGASTVFTIQATTNFLQWTNVGFATGDLSGNFNFIDTNAGKFRYRFYRTTN